MDKLTYFKSFVAIVECGSLKKASDYLNLTASAVSKHLSSLEDKYNTDLIIRNSKRIRITKDGNEFYKKCKVVISKVLEAEEVFEADEKSIHTIRITISQVLAQGPFMEMLNSFTIKHPNIKLHVLTSNSNLDLTKYEIDFAFRGGKLNDSQMKSITILKAKSILCAHSSFKKRFSENSLEVISNNLIIPSYLNLSEYRMYLNKIGVNRPIEEFTSFDDAFSYKNAIVQGLGVGFFLDIFVEKELKEGSLFRIKKPFSFDVRELTFRMIFHKNKNLSKGHETFKDFVKGYFR